MQFTPETAEQATRLWSVPDGTYTVVQSSPAQLPISFSGNGTFISVDDISSSGAVEVSSQGSPYAKISGGDFTLMTRLRKCCWMSKPQETSLPER
jgi:hypothetical protein